MLCTSCTHKTSVMTHNVSNSHVTICRMGWFVLVIGEGREKGRWSLDIGGANAEQSLQILDLQRLTSLKRQCGGSANLARTRQKISHAIHATRIFTFSSEVFSLTFRKSLSSSSSSSSSLVWMAFLKLESNWNQMIIRNCLKPILYFHKSHNTSPLNITITRVTPEE